MREVHFDQVNRDLRLPRDGGDYEIRPFPLPTSPADTGEMRVRLRDAVKVSRGSDDVVLARRILPGNSWRHIPLLAREGQVVILVVRPQPGGYHGTTLSRQAQGNRRGAWRSRFENVTSRRQS